MSITTELRTWMYGHTVNCSDDRIALVAIADRIDAEHERATAGCIHYDPERHYCAVHGDTENGWVKLPVDADGLPIHVGDRVQIFGNDPGTVSHASLASDGWRVYVKYDRELGTGSSDPNFIRHYHPPTVEDVLDEFVARWMDTHHDDLPALKAEYAAKLRLAGDAE